MTKIITVANAKGGVGKTTTAVMIAYSLASRGFRVMLKDSDPQGSSTEWVEDLENLPFDFELSNQRNMGKSKGHDFIIIDTPPLSSDIIKSAIDVADLVIIPTEPSGLDLTRVFALIGNTTHKQTKVLLTKVATNTNSFKYTKALLEEEGIPTFETYIPRKEDIKNSYGKNPLNPALKNYIELVEEMLKELN